MASGLQTLRKPAGCRPPLADTLTGSHGDEISCPAAAAAAAGGSGREVERGAGAVWMCLRPDAQLGGRKVSGSCQSCDEESPPDGCCQAPLPSSSMES